MVLEVEVVEALHNRLDELKRLVKFLWSLKASMFVNALMKVYPYSVEKCTLRTNHRLEPSMMCTAQKRSSDSLLKGKAQMQCLRLDKRYTRTQTTCCPNMSSNQNHQLSNLRSQKVSKVKASLLTEKVSNQEVVEVDSLVVVAVEDFLVVAEASLEVEVVEDLAAAEEVDADAADEVEAAMKMMTDPNDRNDPN